MIWNNKLYISNNNNISTAYDIIYGEWNNIHGQESLTINIGVPFKYIIITITTGYKETYNSSPKYQITTTAVIQYTDNYNKVYSCYLPFNQSGNISTCAMLYRTDDSNRIFLQRYIGGVLFLEVHYICFT